MHCGWVCTCLLLGIIGCQPTETQDPRIAVLRKQFLINLPSESRALSDAVEDIDADREVTLIGRVYAGTLPPWDDGKAAFMMSELPPEGHSDDPDHADNCPFCKRKAEKAPKALVQFHDKDGQVLPIDIRKLFGLKEKDVVVVKGRGQLNDIGIYVINAVGMVIR